MPYNPMLLATASNVRPCATSAASNEHRSGTCEGELRVGDDHRASAGKHCQLRYRYFCFLLLTVFIQHVSVNEACVESLALQLQPCLTGIGIQWDEEGWHYK